METRVVDEKIQAGCSKRSTFFPSQPRRAKTRLSTGKAFKSPSPPLSKGEEHLAQRVDMRLRITWIFLFT